MHQLKIIFLKMVVHFARRIVEPLIFNGHMPERAGRFIILDLLNSVEGK